MTQFYSRIDRQINGDVYNIPFSYIKEEEIEVYLDDVLYDRDKWEFLSEYSIKLKDLSPELPNSTIVSIRRNTDISKKIVTYNNNNLLNKENLNLSQDHLLHSVQEIYDNNIQFGIDIRAEVDDKVEKVSEAVEKLDMLDEAVLRAEEAATKAETEADELSQQADNISDNIEEKAEFVEEQVNKVNQQIEILDDKLEKTLNTITSNKMFDVVMKDHILSFDESKGLVAFGDYAYKTGATGTRYGYPEFYEKCLKYYNEAEEVPLYYTYDYFKVGTLNLRQNLTVGKANASAYNFSTTNYFELNTSNHVSAVNNINNGGHWSFKFTTSDKIETEQTICSGESIYDGVLLRITSSKLKLWLSSNGTSWDIANGKAGTTTLLANTTYTVRLSYDATNANYYLDLINHSERTTTNELTISSTLKLYKQFTLLNIGVDYNHSNPFLCTLHLLENNEPVTYLSSNIGYRSKTARKHTNGMCFIDISYAGDSESLDLFYRLNKGMAWIYGIDTTNERVRIPRNDKYFMCGTDAGAMVQAGLPDHIHSLTAAVNGGGYIDYDDGNGKTVGNKQITTEEASLSSSIYGNSDTVQTDAVKLMGYICVGNTETEIASTEVTEVTTTENDTVPLFTGMYFSFKPNNISWLAKDTVQSKSGKIYETTYNELVKCLNDADNKYNIKVVDVADMVYGVDYSLYWKVNQVDMTFTTPSKWGLVSALTGTQRVLVDKKEPTETDSTWYNLYSDGWLEQGGNTPVNVASATVLLVKPYKDTSYNVQVCYSLTTNAHTDTDGSSAGVAVGAYTTTGFHVSQAKGTTTTTQWMAQGYTEIPSVEDYTEDVYLYFKVGNAVVNQELIDVGTLTEAVNNKIDINSGYIDGQWVAKTAVLTQSVAKGITEIDMSEYLPQDNYQYEVLLICGYYKAASGYICIYSDIIPQPDKVRLVVADSGRVQSSYIYMPIGTERKLYQYLSAATTTSDSGIYGIEALGYRRIGKNA